MIVLADDRTGALETAAAIADGYGFAVTVTANPVQRPAPTLARPAVVDLGTRHLSPQEAARRVRRFAGSATHLKVDSLLRGNWHAEVAAVGGCDGRRVVMVAAFPALGRTCIGGVVRAGGVPVDELADARAAAVTSRPAALLGAHEVTAAGLDDWLRGTGRIAVCDAATDDDLASITRQLAGHPDVILAGTAPAIAADVARLAGGHPAHTAPSVHSGVGVFGARRPAVVVVGSVHPVAIAQADRLDGLHGVSVVRTNLAADSTADELLADLACRARSLTATASIVVIVGGDTAAALLGDEPVIVSGLAGLGMAVCSTPALPGAVVVTKPGSFGDPNALVDLLTGRMG